VYYQNVKSYIQLFQRYGIGIAIVMFVTFLRLLKVKLFSVKKNATMVFDCEKKRIFAKKND
jgi:hypothetical protein